MNMRLLELHDKYLQHGLFDDPEFVNSVTEESVTGCHWTLRRSYTIDGHAIEEQFDIQLFDRDHVPHVRCGLRLVVRGYEAPQEDSRNKIFMPGKWIGPNLEVEVTEQNFISPQALLATTSPEFPLETNNLMPQALNEHPPAPSTIIESSPPTPSDSSIIQKPNKNRETKTKYDSVEYRILSIAEAFRKGSQILASKPYDEPLKRLKTIRRCFDKSIEKERQLMVFWRQMKDESTPAAKIYSKTCSHVKGMLKNVTTIGNVGKYMTGLKDYYCPGKTDGPRPLFRTPKFRLRNAFKRIMGLTSLLYAYYGVSAIAIFTFLQAFQSWYGGEKYRYKDLCENFALPIFKDAPNKIYFEAPTETILRAIRSRLQHITGCDSGHEADTGVENTENGTKDHCPDESKNFILNNAQRLTKHISCEDRELFIAASHGTNKEQENMRLAMRIVNGEALQSEASAASIDVVYMIVDFLLHSVRQKKRQSEPRKSMKRKRALENEADRDTTLSLSETQHGPPNSSPGSLDPNLLGDNTTDQASLHIPPEENQIVSESHNMTRVGE
ncbi:hypothetical protein MAJ_09665, partial [Metarhizium majus ARSEF 297]